MTHCRAKGIALLQVLAAMPLFAVVISVTYMIVNRSVEMERIATYAAINADSAYRAARQIRDDASAATAAQVSEDGRSLTLHLEDGAEVVYTWSGQELNRDAGVDGVFRWPFRRAAIEFRVEDVVANQAVVWTLIEIRSHLERRRSETDKFAIAAQVGSPRT